MSSTNAPVLITGAGPSGMVLALWLQKLGTPFRIVDRLSGPGLTSRAMVIHARTLELYQQLGIADRIIAEGIKINKLLIANAGSSKAHFPIITEKAAGLSKYPFTLSLPQDMHEVVLVDVLKERGTEIGRDIELVDAVQKEDREVVEVKLKHADGHEEAFEASYVIGCDGAHSAVRHMAGIKMEGGTYAGRYFVADIDAEPGTMPAAPDELNMNTSKNEFVMVVPTLKHGNARLVGYVPHDRMDEDHLTFEDMSPTLKACLPDLRVRGVKWFSHYKVHHRHADHFRIGRFFLCGDACHLHSPAGGQGMNTGIGDASNLAWKLSNVLSGRAAPALLDTYEPERLAFAKTLVSTTDRVFTSLTAEGWQGWLTREFLIPYVVPAVVRWTGYSPWDATSQVHVEYKSSPLSENGHGEHGQVKAGERLAWVPTEDGHDNHEALADAKWQVHVYGEVRRDVRRGFQAKGFEVHKFEWSEAAKKRGLAEGALYLVRPDGYIGAEATGGDAETLFRYISKWGLKASL